MSSSLPEVEKPDPNWTTGHAGCADDQGIAGDGDPGPNQGLDSTIFLLQMRLLLDWIDRDGVASVGYFDEQMYSLGEDFETRG